MVGKNRVKHLLRQAEQLQQARRPADPAPGYVHTVNTDPEHIAGVLRVMDEIGTLDDFLKERPELAELLPELYAEMITAAAFTEDAEERAKLEKLLAAIERASPGRYSLKPEDIRAAAGLLQNAGIGVADDNGLSLPDERTD